MEAEFASILDVSSIVVIPRTVQEFQVNDKNEYACTFYDPLSESFIERRGVRVRLQDTFPNIRENRHLAWICVDFARFIFTKVNEKITVRIVHRTASNELITRIYSKDHETLSMFGKVYEPDYPTRSQRHSEIVDYQMKHFGEVCINDLLQNYSEWVIGTTTRIIPKFESSSF